MHWSICWVSIFRSESKCYKKISAMQIYGHFISLSSSEDANFESERKYTRTKFSIMTPYNAIYNPTYNAMHKYH